MFFESLIHINHILQLSSFRDFRIKMDEFYWIFFFLYFIIFVCVCEIPSHGRTQNVFQFSKAHANMQNMLNVSSFHLQGFIPISFTEFFQLVKER